MEEGLTKAERLIEDGHGIPDDILQDDLDRLYDLKRDLIDLLHSAKRRVSAGASAEYAIAIEQQFDDFLHAEESKLLEMLGGQWSEMPRSREYQDWLDSHKDD